MILNPYTERHLLEAYQGTRLLKETFGLVGARILDPDQSEPRLWTLQALYAPLPGRALGGLRARLIDQKGFATFLNQRDLEVLLGMVEPGSWCAWAREDYAEPGDPGWYGFSFDDDDSEDDLHDREMGLRMQSLTGILMNEGLTRRVHLGANSDLEESFMLLWDTDPETGLTPDTRLETIERRWKRFEKTRCTWSRLP